MSFINSEINSTGTEVDFLIAIRKALLEADSRITCDKTEEEIQELFSNNEAYPKIKFYLGSEKLYLLLKRVSKLSSSSNSYEFMVFLNDSRLVSTQNRFGDSTSWNTMQKRNYQFNLAQNTNGLYISFGQSGLQRTDSYSSYWVTIIAIFSSDKTLKFAGAIAGIDGMKAKFRLADNPKSEFYMNINRLPYTLADGKVEVIKNKAVLDSLGNLTGVCGEVLDCSTVPAFVPIEIDGQTYCPINTNTLMKC